MFATWALALSLSTLLVTDESAPGDAKTPIAPIAPIKAVLVVPATLHGDVAVQRAEQELTSALAARGFALQAVTSEPPTHEGLELTLRLDEQAVDLVADGFALQRIEGPDAAGSDRERITLRARDVRGAIYALLELARRSRLDQWRPGAALSLVRNPAFEFRLCSMHDNPGEPPFQTQFRDPKVVLDLGFNGMIVHGLAGLCTYDDYDPRLYPKGGAERAIVLAARHRVKRLVSEAKLNHLLVFLNGDELCVPRSALALYGPEILSPNAAPGRFLISPSKPKVHELVRATFEELCKLFPDVDGFQVRTGEVYTQSEPTLFGHTPTKGIDETCANWTHEDKLRALVATITDVVCKGHGKRFNLRMWGYYNRAHSVPSEWLAFSDALEPEPLRTFSFKHPKTDYWRYNVLNPNFGVGRHAQWAEFQMAREYEGKGAFPNYLGRYLADGPNECAPSGGLAAIHAKGVNGAWCWARGGGWNGPFPAREDWIALNVHAFARLLWDPSDDPRRLANEWSVLHLGFAPHSAAAERFARIQMMSEEALVTSRYLGVFIDKGHLKQGSGWTPDGNWTRDDVLGTGGDQQPASMFYDYMKGDGTIDAAIAERESAIAKWKALVLEFEQLVKDAPESRDIAELYDTALYGQRLFDTSSHAFIAGWETYQWDDGGRKDAALEASARGHLAAAREAWKDYQERVCKLPGVATPYHELGFEYEWSELDRMLAGGARARDDEPAPVTRDR